ncbi:hypothetical protein EUGRSUZ_B01995 [Eucalyptus grandis]|uniref:Uncharacterized protein n=2 Tax=Eucalyptus grandis TaxID=71139 RepID=A0ACC3LS02_EUCGR|nr:hypothetical protein EUGRSUZ_B01995 [Eucalyptus grandis]
MAAAADSPLRLLHLLLLIFSALPLLAPASRSQMTPPPPPPPPMINRYVLAVHKDSATGLHVANVLKRTPTKPIFHLVDLDGGMVWEHCDEQRYVSSTFYAPPFDDYLCSPAGKARFSRTCSGPATPATPGRPGCHNNSCGILAVNPMTKRRAVAELSIDMFSILTTRGSNPGRPIRFCKFYFACAPSSLLRPGLPAGVHGVAGLGRTPISLQSQLASHCGFPPMFALCLTSVSSNDNRGVIFFGDGPYNMLPGVDVSSGLLYTPLTFRRRGKYFVGVRSIRINWKPVPLNTSLLGNGRTRISTTTPYTILEHSIFVAVTRSFTSELSQTPQAEPIPPFPPCYERARFPGTRVGPRVPIIEFVMQDEDTIWPIFGVNSMVEVRPETLCLAFIDGGSRPKDPIVIGAHQLEDNLLQFDVARSRLGFSSSLLVRRTSCANFNFTSIAPQGE